MFSVLVVEDQPIVARQLAGCVDRSRWLTLAGTAGTAQQAIDMARRLRPDLVLLDFALPDSPAGGFGVWDVLHKLDKAPDVIAVTGAKEMSTVERAQRYGAFWYVIKPFTSAIVDAKLADFAEWRRRQLAGSDRTDQGRIDRYFSTRHRRNLLPPGLLPGTLSSILGVLETADGPLRAYEVAEQAEVERGTANRYLTYLCDQGIAVRVPEHGRAGRPAYLYTLAPAWAAGGPA